MKLLSSFVVQSCALVVLALCVLGPASDSLAAQGIKPVVIWSPPDPISYATPLSSLQLDAIALTAAPVQVPLTGVANVAGITAPGQAFLGGFDYDSWSYAGELIGSSIAWRGISSAIGPINQNDVVSSATVPLPAGAFGKLLMLGDMVNNIRPSIKTFTITYTDGTSTRVQQAMSDWVNPRNYPGESVVSCFPWRHNLDGTNDQNSVCTYGYSIDLDPSKTVASLTLPDDRNIVMISFVLLPPAVQGTMTYSPAAGSVLPSGMQTLTAQFTPADLAAYSVALAEVPLSVTPPATPLQPLVAWPAPAAIVQGDPLSPVQLDAQAKVQEGPIIIPIVPDSRVNAIYQDGSHFNEKGFDGTSVAGTSIAYSAEQLSPALSYAGFRFPLGPAAVPDAATSAPIVIPPGNYSTLYLLGAGANGAQLNQPFTISYSDGSTSTANVSMSSWDNPQNFAGEDLVAQTSYADTSAGGTVAGNYDVYGYQLPIDPGRSATGITLPQNTNVIILALGIGSGQMGAVDGSYIYRPPSGTVLPLGVNPLAVVFNPANTTDLEPASGTTTITVIKATLTVEADDNTRVYGTLNPTFTGKVTGANSGDSFSESFTTGATLTSPAGSYAINPTVQGSNLSAYEVVTIAGLLKVSKAPVNLTAGESAAAEIQGQAVTLTATVQSTTTGQPTGTVTFMDAGVQIGTAVVLNGSATLSTRSLAVGTDSVTAQYSGDVDFLPASASTGPSIVVTSADFVLSAPNGLEIRDVWGETASLMLHVSPLSTVYSSEVTLSLATPLPVMAVADFSPATIKPDAGPTDVKFTYHSGLLSERSRSSLGRNVPFVVAALGMVLLPLGMGKRLRGLTRMRLLAWFVAASCLATGLSGCGSGYQNVSLPVIVTATDGVHTHSLTLTLDLRRP